MRPILTRRGLTLTAEQRRSIVGCTDLAVLERWLDTGRQPFNFKCVVVRLAD